MHLDFQRVSADQALRASVPLHFLNEDKSPAGKTAGVLVLHRAERMEVSCLPKDPAGVHRGRPPARSDRRRHHPPVELKLPPAWRSRS